jgi:hypothetical protein
MFALILSFQITRTHPDFGGTFLSPILSTSQYVINAVVDFYVPQTTNNFAQIIADANSQSTATLDNVLQQSLTWIPVPNVNGPLFSIATVSVSPGSHTFTANGTFTVTAFGYGNYSYAYVPALNTGQLGPFGSCLFLNLNFSYIFP